MRRSLRIGAIILAGIAALSVAGPLALQLALSRGVFTAQLDGALERATGRRITYGALDVRFGLMPRIALDDAVIANAPGATQPHFARIRHFEVTLALLPLIGGRVEIDSLLLSGAEIVLERDAEGHGNWVFDAGGGGSSSGGLSIKEVTIEASRILLPGGPVGAVDIDRLEIARDEPEDPLELQGRIRLDGEPLSITASLGRETDGALPLEAAVAAEGISLRLKGRWPRGAEVRDWSLALDAEGEGAAVQRWARRFGQDLPLSGPVSLSARLAPGDPWPSVSDLTLRIGATDLGAVLPGLRIARAELRAASFDAPATLSAQGWRGAADLGLHAQLPSPRRILGEEVLPVEATLTSGRARLELSGPVRRDLDLAGAVFEAQLTAPDLAALGPVVGTDLPRLAGVSARARLGGLSTHAIRLEGLTVSAAPLEAAGDLSVTLAPRLAVSGQLSARRLDLDALGSGAAAGDRRRGAAGRVIPEFPLPIDLLRHVDASLRLAVTHLTAGGTVWRDLNGTLALTGGRLTVDPLAVVTPGGAVGGRLRIDAAAGTPSVSLRLDSRGHGLDLAGLHRAFGVPAGFQGNAELVLDLRGQGSTTRALAATLSGDAGIAMVGGRFTGATALRIGPDLFRLLLPRGMPSGGVALRCLAIRLSAENGVAHSEALLIEGDFGRIDGSIALNLRQETIAARLLPDIRLMGVTVRAPVTIGGTLAEPRIGVDPGAALAHVIGDTVANRLWRSSTVEFLRGATGSAPPGGDCGPALTLARLGRAGAIPEAAATPIPLVPREIQGAAQEVVRGIGGLLGGRRR